MPNRSERRASRENRRIKKAKETPYDQEFDVMLRAVSTCRQLAFITGSCTLYAVVDTIPEGYPEDQRVIELARWSREQNPDTVDTETSGVPIEKLVENILRNHEKYAGNAANN